MDESVSVRSLDPNIRNKTFEEVSLGYNEDEARKEASRCLNCLNPRCVKGCPVHIEIPKFISAIKENNLEEAYRIIKESSSLPGVCGRVCPQEKQCEAMCIKGFKGDAIAIGSLERFVADYALENNIKSVVDTKPNGKKIAVIGSGPSGLSCAGDAAKLGYEVTVFESLHKLGGVLLYGIPKFRLPETIVEKEIESLRNLGVKFQTNVILGKTITIEELKKEYDAIYIATGAGLPKFMGIDNESANGVFSANEILTRINLMESYKEDAKTPIKVGKNVIVIGGGNVAMDAARSMKRLGSNVTLVYRRDEESLPARLMEVHHAKEEGINFMLLTNPTDVVVDDDNSVIGLNVVDMEVMPDKTDGKSSVKEIDNSKHMLECDMIIMAIGTKPNKILLDNSDIESDAQGHIIVDGTKTSDESVFAGGDAVTGSATVILACEAGRNAAKEIHEKLSNI